METINPTFLLHLTRKEVKNNILTMENTIEDMTAHIEMNWYGNLDDGELIITQSKSAGIQERIDLVNLLNDAMSRNIVFETPIPEEYLNDEPWDKNDKDYVSIYSTIFNMILKNLEKDLKDLEEDKKYFETHNKKRDRAMLRAAAFCWDTPESVKRGKEFMEDLLSNHAPSIEEVLQEELKEVLPTMGDYTVDEDEEK